MTRILFFPRLIIVLFTSILIFSVGCATKESDTNSVAVLLESGFKKLKEGNLDGAIEYFNKVISLDDKNPYPYEGLGHAYSEKGDIDRAMEYFNKSISLGNKNSYAYVGLGCIFSRKSDFKKAIGCFNKAISLDDKNPHAYFELGVAYSLLKDQDYTSEKSKILKKLEGLDKDLAVRLKRRFSL